MDDQSFQLVRGAVFGLALGLGLVLESTHPHARLKPAWRTNLGLWAVNGGRFHRVHHGDRDFNVSTALRFHPGELLLSLPIRLVVIVALGAPVLGVVVFEVLFMCANILEHGNFNVPRRLEQTLSMLFVTPALHRWHHSRDVDALNTNFGTVFTIWDRALATFRGNDSATPVITGVPGMLHDGRSLRAALSEPFRR